MFNKTPPEHVRHLQVVCEQLWRWDCALHNSNCKLLQDQVAHIGHMIVSGGFGMQQAKMDVCRRSRHRSMCRDFVFFWVGRLIIVDLSRTLAWSPNLSSFLRARTNIGFGFVSNNKHSRPWSRILVRLHSFGVRKSPNPLSCIQTRVHWIWEQFSLWKMTMAGSMLLLMPREATTLRRPFIRPTREKCWCNNCTRSLAILTYARHIWCCVANIGGLACIIMWLLMSGGVNYDPIRSSFNIFFTSIIALKYHGIGLPLVVGFCRTAGCHTICNKVCVGDHGAFKQVDWVCRSTPKTMQCYPRQPFWIVCRHVLEHRLRYWQTRGGSSSVLLRSYGQRL